MFAFKHGLPRWWLPAAGLALVATFAVLAGRFWHPYYGFTKFVQLDEADQRTGIHEIRDYPVFAYAGFNGYDGASYTQIAFHPLLRSPELQPALGNVPYRARRILGSALAWLLAGGEPSRIASTYAALNLGVWLGLAALLWRVLPVTDARSLLAWTGVLFAAGTLHSVRLALTDLLAATLVVAAIWLGECGRTRGALGVLATAGLARETALAGVAGLWRGPWRSGRSWFANGLRAGLVVLPLLAWMLYVRWQAGPAAQGLGNFTWPVVGWIEKWGATLVDFDRAPNFRWLNFTTLLALLGLSAQAVFFIRRARIESPWWRVGLSGVAMMILLGTSVWEGHPGAATRVLLPMSVAFAVLAVRERVGAGWVAAGSLSVFSGVLALWQVPHGPRDLAAGRFAQGAYLVRVEHGWYATERSGSRAWAWAATRGSLVLETSPRRAGSVAVRLQLRAFTLRAMDVCDGDRVLWQGIVGDKRQWIQFDLPLPVDGRATFEIRSAAPGVPENNRAAARALGFAVYAVTLD